jgi:hypothetical protein
MLAPPLPAFPIRRLLLESGYPRASKSVYLPDLQRLAMVGTFEAMWTALEPLVVTLTLAGYQVPEVVVGRPHGGEAYYDKGCARLFIYANDVVYDPTHWREVTGVGVPAGTQVVTILRLLVRRTHGEPSLYPPIDLDDIPGYTRARDPADLLGDPRDGWLALIDPSTTALPLNSATTLQAPVRDMVVDGLATAWEHQADGRAVGLLRTLDPGLWKSPSTRKLPLRETAAVAGAAFGAVFDAVMMRQFLERGPGDKDATLPALLAGAPEAERLDDAVGELRARADHFHPRNENLPLVLDRLERVHWALSLFSLHEFGLVRILPFPLGHDIGIPYMDLTGWYESDVQAYEASSRPAFIFTMQLNQAGRMIDGWWTDGRLLRWDITGAPPVWTETGSDTVAVDLLFTRDGIDATVRIDGIPKTPAPGVALSITVDFEDGAHPMVRRDASARLSPAVRLKTVTGEALASTEPHLQPLHSAAQLGLNKAIGVLAGEIDRVSGTPSSSWFTQLAVAEGRLRTSLADNLVLVYSASNIAQTPMLERVRADMRYKLGRRASVAPGRSTWAQLKYLLAGAEAQPTDPLPALLGIDVGASEHEYVWKFDNVGVGGEVQLGGEVELGAFVVYGPLDHKSVCAPDPATPHGWNEWVTGAIGEAGGGFGFGIEGQVTFLGGSTDNDLTTTHEWQPDDFARTGPAGILPHAVFVFGALSNSMGLFIGPGGAEVAYEWAESYLWFSRTAPGFGYGGGTSWVVGMGIGVGGGESDSATGTIGRLYFRWGSAQEQIEKPPEAPVEIVGGASDSWMTSFAVDSDELAPEARDHIATQVARHRALFEQPTALLIIEGDASPTGSEAYNESLSWRRALSLYRHIRTLLTSVGVEGYATDAALAVVERGVTIVGHGELRGRLEDGLPDDVEVDEWRRSKFFINGRVVVLV